ncbi:MAG: nicotinate (nicotinamide) nucleotide adenylyltransferase [Oscillospiraceae bacterium]|nr:nicotinate (nicotinamide) nucleotide adenylyltransferase [Oscillospiraceae bacterium]
MSIALFGGSFNPIHKGHVNLAKSVIDSHIGADRIIIMPTYISPFKQGADNVEDGKHRTEMCRLAFEGMDNVTVSDHELSQGGVSYTVNTLKYLRELYPDERLWLIVGSDSLDSLPRWYRFEEIMSLCSVAAAARSDEDILKIEEFAVKVRKFGTVETVKTVPFEISSTEIRKKILNNEDISCYLPENVVKYILCNQLYMKRS